MTLIATLRERFLKRFLDTLRIIARTYAEYDTPNAGLQAFLWKYLCRTGSMWCLD